MFVFYLHIEWNIHIKKSSFHPQLLIALLSNMWNTHIAANTRRGFLTEEHIVGLSYTKTSASPSNWYWQNINTPLTSLHCAVSITRKRPLFETSSGADYIHWFWFFLTKPHLCRPVSIEVMQMHRIKAFLYSVLLNKNIWLSSLTFPVSISVFHWTVSVSWLGCCFRRRFLPAWGLVGVVWSVRLLLWEMWNGAKHKQSKWGFLSLESSIILPILSSHGSVQVLVSFPSRSWPLAHLFLVMSSDLRFSFFHSSCGNGSTLSSSCNPFV